MMKKLGFVSVALIGVAASGVSVAGGITDTDVISRSYVHAQWTEVKLPNLVGAAPGTKNNPDSCPSTDYYAIAPTDVNYKAMHANLLAAQMAGKKVFFYVSGCGGQNNAYPKISSVFIETW